MKKGRCGENNREEKNNMKDMRMKDREKERRKAVLKGKREEVAMNRRLRKSNLEG